MEKVKVQHIRGNEEDCICHKPNEKHTERCDAYRLSEFFKKCASVMLKRPKHTKEDR